MNRARLLPLLAALLATPAVAEEASAPVAATASAPVQLRSGVLVVTSSGRRVGLIDRVVGPNDAPTAVKVIKEMQIVQIPVATLTASGVKGRVITSMAYSDIR